MPRAKSPGPSHPQDALAHSEDLFGDTLRGLLPSERRFVRGLLSGLDYQDAFSATGKRHPHGVVIMLGKSRVRDAVQRLAPLLPDQRHARRLLEPFALSALAANLSGSAPAATRTSAAREITAPASALDPRNQPHRGGAGGPPKQQAAWERAQADREARRAAAREADARTAAPLHPVLQARDVREASQLDAREALPDAGDAGDAALHLPGAAAGEG